MPAPSDHLPTVGQSGTLRGVLNLPVFTAFEFMGSTGNIAPLADVETFGGIDEEDVVDFWTKRRMEVTGTMLASASAANKLKLGGCLVGKADPNDANNIFVGAVLQIRALRVTRAIHGKPAEYEVTLLYRQNFQTAADLGGDLDGLTL